MGEKQLNIHSNGNVEAKHRIKKENTDSIWLWHGIPRNEWTFSLLIFFISSSMVLMKLYTYYGGNLQLQNSVAAKYKIIASSTPVLSNLSTILSHLPDVSQFHAERLSVLSEKFVNVSQYDDVASVTMSFYKTFGWLIRATVCGLFMIGFTWFIIYKDSNIPGINPPSPFGPSKHRFTKESRMQMNYFIGILNGVLIFVYMCL